MNWQLIVPAVTSLAGIVLAAIFARFWQGELRRLQLESETRLNSNSVR